MKKILGLFLGLIFCTSAFAQPFKQIIFFGDSLSDNGNLFRMLKIEPPSPPYYQGRFSNGHTWAENLDKYYYDKYYIGAVNYCYGGATALAHNPSRTQKTMGPMTLESELDFYFIHSLMVDKSQILYVFWIGANDYLYDQSSDAETLTTNVVNKISWALTSLINKGATKFLILNLPDMAKSPYGLSSPMGQRLHIFADLHNKKLAEKIKQLQAQYPAVKFMSIDIYDTFNDLLANPEKYNQQYNLTLKNTTEPCVIQTNSSKNAVLNKSDSNPEDVNQYILNSPSLVEADKLGKSFSICANAKEHVFWDAVHPSESLHQVITGVVINRLKEEGED